MSTGQTPQSDALARIELPATGERFVTQNMTEHIQVAYEHLHRYLVAQECCRGKDVLDIASGEGYGSNILAQSAKSVLGVDISNDAVLFARQKYKRANLRFQKGDCTRIPLGKNSVDTVVSFETIEHILEQETFIKEIKRVLRPNGLLIISSPDKHEYSDRSGYTNPFHIAELYRADFLRLLRRNFKNCRSLQQRLIAGSFIAADADSKTDVCYGTHRGNLQGGTFNEGVHEGLYTVAVCSDGALPEILAGVFENRAESARIWHAFEELDNVRADMETLRGYLEDERRRIRECEAEKLRAQTHYQELSLRYDNLEAALKRQNTESTQQILTLESRAAELDQEAVARGEWGKRLDGEIEALRAIVAEQRTTIESLEQQHKADTEALRANNDTQTRGSQETALLMEGSVVRETGLQSENLELNKLSVSLQSRVTELDKELTSRHDTAQQYEQQLNQLQQLIAEKEATITALLEEKALLLNRNNESEQTLRTVDESRATLAQERDRLLAEATGLRNELHIANDDKQQLTDSINNIEKEKAELVKARQDDLQKLESLGAQQSSLTKEKENLREANAGLDEKIHGLLQEKTRLEHSIQALETSRCTLLDDQGKHTAENETLRSELNRVVSLAQTLNTQRDNLIGQIQTLEIKLQELEAAHQHSSALAEDSQTLLEQFMARISNSLETARSEISCLNESQLVQITETATAEILPSPMQTELCALQTKTEDIAQQMDSDQRATQERLKESLAATQSLSREKTLLKELVARMDADWVQAEQQIVDAQSQLWQVLTESENKLHWAASLDRDLCSMRKAVVERDEMIEKERGDYKRLEETLLRAEQALEEKTRLLQEAETRAAQELNAQEHLAKAIEEGLARDALSAKKLEELRAQSEQEMQRQQSAKQTLEKLLSEKTDEAARLSQHIDQIKESFAWKASAPLRLFNKNLSEKKTS